MGQKNSSRGGDGDDAVDGVTKEIDYLAEHTHLNQEQLRALYEKYFAEDKISKKDFLKEFSATFPK